MVPNRIVEVSHVWRFQASFGIYSLYPFLRVSTRVLTVLAQFKFILSLSPCEKAGARLHHFFLLCRLLCRLSPPNIVTKRSHGEQDSLVFPPVSPYNGDVCELIFFIQ